MHRYRTNRVCGFTQKVQIRSSIQFSLYGTAANDSQPEIIMNKDCKIKVKRGARNTVGSANKLLIGLFAGFISVFFLLIIFLPKHEGELSPNERRVLASAPNTSLGNILSGKFSGEVDTWMEDHFPARNAFVSIYSHMNLYSGRSIVEKVTLGKNNRLFSAPVQRDDETMKTNAEKFPAL